jgi:hypothetical protein
MPGHTLTLLSAMRQDQYEYSKQDQGDDGYD